MSVLDLLCVAGMAAEFVMLTVCAYVWMADA